MNGMTGQLVIFKSLKNFSSDTKQNILKLVKERIGNKPKRLHVPLKITISSTKIKLLKDYQCNNTLKALDNTYLIDKQF